MHAIPVGAIAGAILSATTSYLVTARIFHRFQRKTPETWRGESWLSHGAAMVLQAVAGAAIGGVFVAAGAPSTVERMLELGIGLWGAIAAVLLIQAIYVRWHWGFVFGSLLDWLIFVSGVLAACFLAQTR